MDIILQGVHKGDEAIESIKRVLDLFKERYHIEEFCEVHLMATLIDDQGEVVELVDSETDEAYRTFEVFRDGYELANRKGIPVLKLIVDNTK